MDSLKRLLSRLQNACLTAKLSKCTIACREIECLGHIVGLSGMSPNPDKVKEPRTAERPTTKGQVRSFLGLVGFIRRYILNFSLQSTLVSNFAGRGKKLETAGVRIKNSAMETGSYYRKSGHGKNEREKGGG